MSLSERSYKVISGLIQLKEEQLEQAGKENDSDYYVELEQAQRELDKIYHS